MQVKKFEARSMKEALDLVKSQLGPDAIILSAKDNSRSYGLAGNGSVEITAAVSEEVLQKKKFVESRMRNEDRDKIRKAPARVQKQFMDDMVNKYTQEKAPRRSMTSTPYIDIEDSPEATRISARPQWNETPVEEESQSNTETTEASDAAGQRIRGAAHRAWNAMNAQLDFLSSAKPAAPATAAPTAPNMTTAPAAVPQEVSSLRQEVAQLKSVLSQFQQVPQSFNNSYPGAEYGLPYEMAGIFEKLQTAGMSNEIIGEVLVEAQKQMPAVRFKNKPLIEGWVARHIMDTTPIVGDMQGTKIQIFAGPAGSGKTASLVKLASHYVVNGHKKVALLTTDIYKVGASDQLKIYSQILNVPFAVVRTAADWDYILRQLSGYDYVLCDCPGLSLKSVDEIQMLKNLLPRGSDQVTVHLVLNSTLKDQDLNEMGRRYKAVNFKDVIFTCLDDSIQHGSIYNFVRRFNAPLHSFGLGTRVPEDFEMATRERVVDLIFKLSKVKKADEAS